MTSIKNIASKFLDMDKLSQLFILGFIFCGILLTKNYSTALIQALNDIPLHETYKSDVLNFTINYPEGWQFDSDEKAVLDSISKITRNVPFDTYTHALTSEVTPLILLGDAGKVGTTKYLSLSFGAYKVERLSELQEFVKQGTLTVLERTTKDLKVTKSQVVKSADFVGVLTQIEGIDTETSTKVYFTDLTTQHGYNYVSLLEGVTHKQSHDLREQKAILNSLKFFNATSVPTFPEEEEVDPHVTTEKSTTAPEFKTTTVAPEGESLNKKK